MGRRPLLRHPLRHYLRREWFARLLAYCARQVHAELTAWKRACLMRIPGEIGSAIRKASLGFKRVGRNVVIWDMVWVQWPENICIGDDVRIHPMSYLDGAGGICIGSHVGIAAGVRLYSVNHRYKDPTRLYSAQGYNLATIVVEDDVWIGTNAIVVAGVRLRRGTVVAAGAVVTKDTEPYSVVGGIPARLIGQRDGDGLPTADMWQCALLTPPEDAARSW
jgi:maltose O-acetyltransferase